MQIAFKNVFLKILFQGRSCELNYNDCLIQSCSTGFLCIDGINNITCLPTILQSKKTEMAEVFPTEILDNDLPTALAVSVELPSKLTTPDFHAEEMSQGKKNKLLSHIFIKLLSLLVLSEWLEYLKCINFHLHVVFHFYTTFCSCNLIHCPFIITCLNIIGKLQFSLKNIFPQHLSHPARKTALSLVFSLLCKSVKSHVRHIVFISVWP